jgi:hypothetical protein
VLGSMKMVLNSTKNLRKQHMIAKFFDVWDSNYKSMNYTIHIQHNKANKENKACSWGCVSRRVAGRKVFQFVTENGKLELRNRTTGNSVVAGKGDRDRPRFRRRNFDAMNSIENLWLNWTFWMKENLRK